jgi:hypothetical protein
MEIVLASGILTLCGVSVVLLILIVLLARTQRAILTQVRRQRQDRLVKKPDERP